VDPPSSAAAAASPGAMAGDDPSYALKRIKFFNRSVSIVLQNVNGPCPLLAIGGRGGRGGPRWPQRRHQRRPSRGAPDPAATRPTHAPAPPLRPSTPPAANVLSLRNLLKLPGGARDISQERLVTMVADLLLEASRQCETAAGGSAAAAAHAAHAVSECFEVLAKLTTGIDVNVKFWAPTAFEPTREVSVFDLLGITLVHGWLVDPARDARTAAVFGKRSYNELVELLLAAGAGDESDAAAPAPGGGAAEMAGAGAAAAGAGGAQARPPADSNGGVAGGGAAAAAAACQSDEDIIHALVDQIVASVASEGAGPADADAPAANGPASGSETLGQPQQQQQQQQQQQAHDAAVVRAFMERHCSQLTAAGLAALAAELREHQLAVFFRNNHFSTAFKHEGHVYLLVTDQGYASEPDVVWERLDAVDGNTTLVDSGFQQFVPHAEAPYNPAAFEAAAAVEEADFALALQLQLAEEDAAAAARQQQQAAAAARAAAPAQQPGSQPAQAQGWSPARGQPAQQQYAPPTRPHRPSSGSGGRRERTGRLAAGGPPTPLEAAAARMRDKVEEKCSMM
jgi:hypothetical protein